MTHLTDVLDVPNLDKMITEGYIRKQTSPTGGLTIFNYSEKAVFDGMWNHETMTCRGLIVDSDGNVVARPFRKFFNLAQHESPNVPDAPTGTKFRLFDKADGSLGILFPTPNGEAAIATRGSFTSEQAIKATQILHDKYQDWLVEWNGMAASRNHTLLFEIVYPDNRIVLDYGDMEDLVYLGSVNIETGQSYMGNAYAAEWPGPVAEEYWLVGEFDPADLAAENRPNKEGYVLWYPDTDQRVKVKHTEYLTLHRLVTNTSTKSVWRLLSQGLEDELKLIPDEFREQVDRCVSDFYCGYEQIANDAAVLFDVMRSTLGDDANRGDIARFIIARAGGSTTVRAVCFAMLDDKPYDQIIWRSLEPNGSESLWL